MLVPPRDFDLFKILKKKTITYDSDIYYYVLVYLMSQIEDLNYYKNF